MVSVNQRDYLNQADVNGVRNLTLYCSPVQTELHNVMNEFLIWLKPLLDIPIYCSHSVIVYPNDVPAFDEKCYGPKGLSPIHLFGWRE
jgi:hypothetical protein